MSRAAAGRLVSIAGTCLAAAGCALSPWQMDGRDGPAPPSPFTRLDTDGDGYLTAAEFGSGPGTTLEGDTDGDGRMDYPEFQAWLPTRMRIRRAVDED